MQLRIEGTLEEIKMAYLAIARHGFKPVNPKCYANAQYGEDRRLMKRQIPPFSPKEITDDLMQKHGDREFRLYCSASAPSRAAFLASYSAPPEPDSAVLGGFPQMIDD